MDPSQQSISRYYSFGPFCLDATRLLLYNRGKTVSLAPRFVRALLILVQNRAVDLNKDYLIDQLWPETAVEENNLTVIISALRKVFGDEPGQHRYIVTIPGRGYRFVADVIEGSIAPADITSVQSKPSFVRDASVTPLWQSKAAWLSSAAVLIALLLLGVWIRGRIIAKASTVQTLAVLPFESVGFGSDRDYLGLGMADALASRLRNVPHIYVKPTGEVIPYQNSAYDPPAAGRTLGVNLVLTGSVTKSGDRIDVLARLLRVKDSGVLWSSDFKGELGEILGIQDRISGEAAYALTHTPPNATPSLRHQYTRDPDAYQLYLHGEFFLKHRSRSRAEDDLNKAIAYFQQAAEKDPKFGLAYASMANAYDKLSWYVPAEDSYAKAELTAEKALTIDDSLAEAYRSLAVAKQAYRWDFNAADAAYRRAIELDPDDSSSHRWYADELLAMGQNERA
jgi:serine/threonine-protein kinase